MSPQVAILYQFTAPPESNGIRKPMKPGGYADSGADIAYALQQQSIEIITPVRHPAIENDLDWVFPDSTAGIQAAIDGGANTIWLNTLLYKGHPIEAFLRQGISVVGQIPAQVERYDDKWTTNHLLQAHGLPIPPSVLITRENTENYTLNFPFPVVAKPIRGRGSQGVSLVQDAAALSAILAELFATQTYGDALYVEAFLPGQELTITVMPPGNYSIGGSTIHRETYWSLPPVKRFNHENGIAPYNGIVAVIHNSAVLSDEAMQQPDLLILCRQCEKAAELVRAKAPIRIDCRADATGQYFLFDLNMKPNMTGPSRPHRTDQDSLTALAARKIGWRFEDLVRNMLRQCWKK